MARHPMDDDSSIGNDRMIAEGAAQRTKTPQMLSERPSEDNWKNRATGMRCSTCMFYVQKEDTSLKPKGRCRRRAPTMNGYPVVFLDDWCGDHKLR